MLEQLPEHGQPRVLVSDTVTVITLRIGEEGEGRRLVKIVGAKGGWGSTPTEHERVENGDFVEWRKERDGGGTYRTLIEQESGYGSAYKLWLPGKRLAIHVEPDEGAAEDVDAEELLREWQGT